MRELLLKYIAGETNEKESEQVENWLSEDQAHFNEFEQLWNLWFAVGLASKEESFDIDRGWLVTLRKINATKLNQKKHRRVRRIWALSACIAAVLIVGIIFYAREKENDQIAQRPDHSSIANNKERAHPSKTGKEQSLKKMDAATVNQQQKKIALPDGSIVWLNGKTKISFIESKREDKRILHLTGEAFFDIKNNAQMPFIVKTKYATIKVLGTRFNVSAYPDDSVVEATLTQGSILFSAKMKDNKIKRHIKPGQKAVIHFLSGKLEVSTVDTVFYSSWKEGRLLFRGQTFGEVAKAMSHKYNVQFVFRTRSLMKRKLSGYLQKETLKQALEALKLTLQFQYRMEGDKVIIYR